jgi:dihydrofolate reductase
VLREENLLAEPQKWQHFYGSRPTYVFSSRDLPKPDGARVEIRQGPVAEHLPEIRAAAGDLDVWLMGGGDLVGQFLDVGALDEIVLSVAPVTLASGAPLLPRRLESDRLTLTSVRQEGQFANLVLAVRMD